MTEALTLPALLELLGYEADEHLQLCFLEPGGIFHSEVIATEDVPPLPQDRNVWFSINPTRGPARKNAGRGAAADVTRLAAVYCDLDLKADGCPDEATMMAIVEDLSAALGTPPSAITMSGHGMQPIWPIEDGGIDNGNLRGISGSMGTDLSGVVVGSDSAGESSVRPGAKGLASAQAAALLRRWGRLVSNIADRRGAGVDSVFDLPRILRAPCSVNWKHRDAPVTVATYRWTGSPISIERLRETLAEYNIPELVDDGTDPGVVLSTPTDWQWAERTCGYVQKMVAAWATDTPGRGGRHPWFQGQAVRLAAAHRNGCITEADYTAAQRALESRFGQLVGGVGDRAITPGETRDMLSWGVRTASTFSPVHLAGELGNHQHLQSPEKPLVGVVSAVPASAPLVHLTDETPTGGSSLSPAVTGLWARPEIAHIAEFARARQCAPWAVLGCVLCRVACSVPPNVVLPATVGDVGSLNLFVALYGPSGSGKSAAISCSSAAVDLPSFTTAPLGSGEGISRSFAYRRQKDHTLVWVERQVLFTASEVDSLAALTNRQGATLGPQLREVFTGGELGFAYANAEKRIILPSHSYRASVIVGVQPDRAVGLLGDSGGGTPQRFLWLPTIDPALPNPPPTYSHKWQPPRLTWPTPLLPEIIGDEEAEEEGKPIGPPEELAVCDEAIDAITQARHARQTNWEATGADLDGHILYVRLKVAAALSILAGRKWVKPEDWADAGEVIECSNVIRSQAVAHLHEQNRRRDFSQVDREMAAAAYKDVIDVKRMVELIKTKAPRFTSVSALRKSMTSRDRQLFDDVIDMEFNGVLPLQEAS